jgi:tellurite methyltransferase
MDKEYWNKYYLKHSDDNEIAFHSSFAEFCELKYFFQKEYEIVELGSGNGRDAIYFAHKGHNVYALDQSTAAIDAERYNISEEVKKNLNPVASDFVKDSFSCFGDIDVIYSRFTLHAISQKDEDIILPKIYSSIRVGGLFCIEARTINDLIFGRGKDCGDNIFFTDHKRRFIDSNAFLKKVLSLGFKLVYFTEENNLSIYKEDNPVLMRAVFNK